MYLRGKFIGKSSKLVIDGNTKEDAVLAFLKLNPELEHIIKNEASIKNQCKLMGLEFKKTEVKTEVKTVAKAKKIGVKKGSKKR